jgi:hemerythrin-like metal-binding protein
MAIQWTEELATGIERIDAQHRDLYAQVAALHEVMRTNQLDRIPAVLDGLRKYALEHFATEEREMAARGFPRLAQHRVLHQNFVDEFLRQRALMSANVTLSGVVALSVWLTDWLREHVRKEDGQLAEFIRGQKK